MTMTNIPKRYLLCALLAGALAACKEPDAFYSTAYDIVRVEIDVELEAAAAPDPDDGSGGEPENGEPDGGVSDGGVSDGKGSDDSTEVRSAADGEVPDQGAADDRVSGGSAEVRSAANGEVPDRGAADGGVSDNTDYRALIAEEAADWAPVASGGGYLLDYTRYDGGPLRVRTAAGSETIGGAFLRTPGTDTIGFVYDGRMHAYTLAAYEDEQGRTRTLLQADLTDLFRARYPEAGIVRVLRLEYTSHE